MDVYGAVQMHDAGVCVIGNEEWSFVYMQRRVGHHINIKRPFFVFIVCTADKFHKKVEFGGIFFPRNYFDLQG